MTAVHPELVRAFRDANREAAEAVVREVARVESLRAAGVEPDALKRWAERAARAATRDVIAAADEGVELWEAMIPTLRSGTVGEQVAVLRGVVELADSLRGRVPPVRQLWAAIGEEGAEVSDLDGAVLRLDRMHREVTRAIECRLNPWKPADPARFEQAMRDVAEGKAKFLGPDEARAWFRRNPG